ncbi:hypothetical protein LOTGIDRAFT_160797 [Lottia gigantea]|uniref:Uncharacterized protein n=1 Tax=Lottia gigantea TaxID=225164 RepID=V4AJX5_LOTGI|nr:hypothetical protein LOTGIDRAFT_160797 [Lottia gigantea]ESO95035.1 hypothetical protein LOTGIDRAFT_160797 [Lottia gigantea]
MKCLLVVNRMNDVRFLDFDDDFARFVNEQAIEIGLLQPEDHGLDAYYVDPNVIMQIFSPLVLSQWFLIEQTKNPCSSVTCDNGFIFVFKQMDDLLLVAINGDGSETEELLMKKIQMFLRLIGFLFGPATDEIGRYEDKKERWNFLRRLLETWMKLCCDEQSFLVEAVERLHVNQALSEKCIELLEEGVEKIQNIPTHHALLLVNNKLLALYSNRGANELQPADILSIILLAKDVFPSKERLEDLFSRSYSMTQAAGRTSHQCLPSTARMPTDIGDDSEPEDDQYHSAQTTPRSTPTTSESSRSYDKDGGQDVLDGKDGNEETSADSRPKSVSPNDQKRSPYPQVSTTHGGHESDVFFTPKDDVRLDSLYRYIQNSDTPSQSKRTSPEFFNDYRRPRSNTAASYDESIKNTRPLRSDHVPEYWRQMIFLHTRQCEYSPHQLHCTQILPGIVLILVTEGIRGAVAGTLCQIFAILKDLLAGKRDKLNRGQGQNLYDVVNSLLAKVQGHLKKVRGRSQRIVSEIKNRWESDDLKQGLFKYLESDAGVEADPLIETTLSDLFRKLKELFSLLYLSPKGVNESIKETILSLQKKIKVELADYRDFLTVKAQRRLMQESLHNGSVSVIEAVQNRIKGNRQSHQLTAPSLNITNDILDDPKEYIKEKIWSKYQYAMLRLSEGYVTSMVQDGDFYFSYFLWFEDNRGSPLQISEPFKTVQDLPPPGLLTGPFYKLLVKQCFPNYVTGSVRCYELFMMHIGLVKPQYIALHCQQLARKLWDMSGEVMSHFITDLAKSFDHREIRAISVVSVVISVNKLSNTKRVTL